MRRLISYEGATQKLVTVSQENGIADKNIPVDVKPKNIIVSNIAKNSYKIDYEKI